MGGPKFPLIPLSSVDGSRALTESLTLGLPTLILGVMSQKMGDRHHYFLCMQRGGQVVLSDLLYHFLLFLLRQGLSLNMELGQRLETSVFTPFPRAGVTGVRSRT